MFSTGVVVMVAFPNNSWYSNDVPAAALLSCNVVLMATAVGKTVTITWVGTITACIRIGLNGEKNRFPPSDGNPL